MRMRVEDLDTARCKTEYIESLFRDFEWLGLTWEGEVVYQSRRNDLYIGTLREIKVFGFWGEYGRKAET